MSWLKREVEQVCVHLRHGQANCIAVAQLLDGIAAAGWPLQRSRAIGDEVEVQLELDEAPRVLRVPKVLSAPSMRTPPLAPATTALPTPASASTFAASTAPEGPTPAKAGSRRRSKHCGAARSAQVPPAREGSHAEGRGKPPKEPGWPAAALLRQPGAVIECDPDCDTRRAWARGMGSPHTQAWRSLADLARHLQSQLAESLGIAHHGGLTLATPRVQEIQARPALELCAPLGAARGLWLHASKPETPGPCRPDRRVGERRNTRAVARQDVPRPRRVHLARVRCLSALPLAYRRARNPRRGAILGTDDATPDTGTMLYFDVRNLSREYRLTVAANVWRWSRDEPGFSQRRVLTIA